MESQSAIAVIGLILALLVAVGILYSVTQSPQSSPPPPPPGPPPESNRIYQGQDLLDLFTSYPVSKDPTGGISNYNSGEKLTSVDPIKNRVLIGTAGSTPFPNVPVPSSGTIPSSRLFTSKVFNGGLFSIEVFHLPAGEAVWPAVWLSQDLNQPVNGRPGVWPDNGEIDWIEQVYNSSSNQSTLHIGGWTACGLVPDNCQRGVTVPGCSSVGCRCPVGCPSACKLQGDSTCPYACSPIFTGTFVGDPHCSTFDHNRGCGMKAGPGTFGPDFNSDNAGSTFSLLWKTNGDLNEVNFWFFPKESPLLQDTSRGPFGSSPDPSEWGAPYGRIDASAEGQRCVLQNLQLIINIAICGSWPNSVFPGGEAACQASAYNSSNLSEAYFELGRLAIVEHPS